MKVKIPVNHHIRLHAMRVVDGTPISDVVTEALDAYFRDLDRGSTPPGSALRAGFAPPAAPSAPATSPARET